jgi:CRP-like cAMP-binding protein
MQDLNQTLTLLEEHPFLKGLDTWYLEQLARYADYQTFTAGEYLLREGGDADKFFLILEGEIVVGLETKKIFSVEQSFHKIQTLGAGDILGWSWLLPPYVWHFDAKAILDSRAIVLNGKYLRAKCEEDKGLGFELLKRLTQMMLQRLNEARLKLIHADVE